jgi:hypothetical protein
MTASAAKEMLGEYIKRTREKAGSLKPEDTNYVLIKAQEEMLNDMKAGNIPMMQEEHLWYMVNIIAESNWAKVNFQKVLSAELFRAGHDVSIEKGVDTAMGEQIKERAVEIEIKKAEETSGATARFESYSVAKQAAELSNDPDIRRDGEKSLKAIATGLSDKEITKEFVLLDNKKGWRDELMTRFIFENPEVGIIKDMGVVARKAQNRVKGGIECPLDDKYKANITTYLKMLKVEELISILNLDNMDTEFSVETPGLEEWAKEVDKISPKKKEKIVFFLGSKDHKFPAMSVGTKKKGRNGKTTYQRRYAQMAIWVLEKIGYRFEAKKGKQPSYRLSAEYITQTEEREKLLAGLARKYKVGIESPTETTIEVSQQPEDFDDEFGLMQFLPENQEKFDDEFGLMQFLPENQENSLTLTQ